MPPNTSVTNLPAPVAARAGRRLGWFIGWTLVLIALYWAVRTAGAANTLVEGGITFLERLVDPNQPLF